MVEIPFSKNISKSADGPHIYENNFKCIFNIKFDNPKNNTSALEVKILST